MSNLVADRRDVADSRVETLLRVRRAIQTLTDFGPNVVRKQQGRELTKVKIVHDGQWLRSGRARSERSGKRLTLTLRQSRFNPLGRFLAEMRRIDVSNQATKRALDLHDALPHCLRTWQEPRRHEQRSVCLSS